MDSGYMYSNQLHINLIKSVFIHFRPHRNSTERQTCVRAKVEKSLQLANHRLKRQTCYRSQISRCYNR